MTPSEFSIAWRALLFATPRDCADWYERRAARAERDRLFASARDAFACPALRSQVQSSKFQVQSSTAEAAAPALDGAALAEAVGTAVGQVLTEFRQTLTADVLKAVALHNGNGNGHARRR